MDNNMKDLEDDKHISEPGGSNSEQDGQRKGRRQTAMHRRRWYDVFLDRRVQMIALIVLVLLILIVVYNKKAKHPAVREESTVAESVTVAATEETTVAETEDPTIVREYYDEYLTAFFEQYFDARLQADTDTLYTLTGVSNQTEEQTELLKTQLKTQAGYIEAYQDIKQYAVNAVEENSKLVFVTYNVKFRRVETLAPGIMYCYVRVNDSNQFEIVENLTPEQTKFVNEYITNHTEVQEIINSNNSKLLQAISSDERLAVIYDAFQSGRIYTDSQETIDSEVSLIEVDGDEVAGTADSGAEGDGAADATATADGATADAGAAGDAAGAETAAAGSTVVVAGAEAAANADATTTDTTAAADASSEVCLDEPAETAAETAG